jgi:hypothetical protein
LFLGLAFGMAAGCGDDESKTFDACIDGDTRECLGPAACKGAQACKPDGSGFEPCTCGTDGAGGDGNEPVPGGGGAAMNAGGMSTGATDAGGAPGIAGSGEPPLGGSATEGGAAGAGGKAPQWDCHLVGNVGCDATHNCSIDGGVDPECVLAGTKQVLEKCNNTTECAPGLSCHLNNCLKVCGETEDCQTQDGAIKCGLGYNNEEFGFGAIGGCVTSCDVLAQNCPAGQACYLGSCMTPTLALAEGAECGFGTDCAKGLDCLLDRDGDSAPDCSKYCSTAVVSDQCGVGFACYPLNEAFPTLPATWGVCSPE